MLHLIEPTRPFIIDGKEHVSETEGIETLIYKLNLDEFEDLDDDCLASPNHLGCIWATSFHMGQPENGLKVDPVNSSIVVSPFEGVHCFG